MNDKLGEILISFENKATQGSDGYTLREAIKEIEKHYISKKDVMKVIDEFSEYSQTLVYDKSILNNALHLHDKIIFENLKKVIEKLGGSNV